MPLNNQTCVLFNFFYCNHSEKTFNSRIQDWTAASQVLISYPAGVDALTTIDRLIDFNGISNHIRINLCLKVRKSHSLCDHIFIFNIVSHTRSNRTRILNRFVCAPFHQVWTLTGKITQDGTGSNGNKGVLNTL